MGTEGSSRAAVAGMQRGTHSSWCLKRAPVRCSVACGGAIHRIRWDRGKIVLEQHDLGAEETLAYLGAPEAGCVAVLAAWRRRQLSKLPPDLAAVASEAQEVSRWRSPPESVRADGPDDRFRQLTARMVTEAFRASRWRRAGRDMAVLVRFDEEGSPQVSSWGVSHRSRTVEGVEVAVDSRWATRVGRRLSLVDGTVVLGAVAAGRPDRRVVWLADWAEGGLRPRLAVLSHSDGRWQRLDAELA